MGQYVHARISRDGLGHGGNKLRVDDGNIRGQLIVGQRIFDVAILLVGDDREGGHLAAGAGGGGDGDHLGLFAQIGEMECTFADIHKL